MMKQVTTARNVYCLMYSTHYFIPVSDNGKQAMDEIFNSVLNNAAGNSTNLPPVTQIQNIVPVVCVNVSEQLAVANHHGIS